MSASLVCRDIRVPSDELCAESSSGGGMVQKQIVTGRKFQKRRAQMQRFFYTAELFVSQDHLVIVPGFEYSSFI
ncbi:MAG: hypothetical protein VX106_04325 [Pseudomonadota bacterium]|nr:hypothetical protein [Pseudomonadota bacterium]